MAKNPNNWLVGELAEVACSGAIARIDEVSGTTAKCFLGSKTWIKVDTAYLRETTETSYHLPSWLKVGYWFMGTQVTEIKRGPVVLADGSVTTILALLLDHKDEDSTEEGFDDAEEIKEEPAPAPIPVPPVSPTPITQTAATDAYTAMAAVFAGVEQNVVRKCMEVIQPYLNKVHRTELTITTPEGKKIDFGQRVLHCQFKKVCNLVQMRIPVYMYGPAGSGKNDLCADVAKALGLDFYYLNSITDEVKLIGYKDAGGVYHETEFFRAFTKGGLLNLDEIDASCPDTLVIMNAAIANGYFTFPDGIRHIAHKDFRVIAAGNTFGTGANDEYTGRQPLDASTLNRFAIIEVDYDPAIESAICGGDDEILDFAHEVRRIKDKDSLPIPPVSYRTIIMMSKFDGVFEDTETLKMAVLKGTDKDTIRGIKNRYSANKENRYYKSLLKLA